MTPMPVPIMDRTIVAVAVVVSPSYHVRCPVTLLGALHSSLLDLGLRGTAECRRDHPGDRVETTRPRSSGPAWKTAGFPARRPNQRTPAGADGASGPCCLHTPGAGYSLKMCAPSMPARALRVSTTTGARRATSA